ncbi:MAG: hypothetical protein HY879_04850 [Deltaproteobacteria bacterium]|nr:hypothetical protein [Deltaproteobacteria bacterium]
MKKDIFEDKRILAVDATPEILDVLEEKIRQTCRDCQFEKAVTYSQAIDLMVSWSYDLVILAFPGIRALDLIEVAWIKNMPVVLLAPDKWDFQKLHHLIEKGVKVLWSRNKIGELIPILESLLFQESQTGWRRYWHQKTDHLRNRTAFSHEEKNSFWVDMKRRSIPPWEPVLRENPPLPPLLKT